MKNKIITLGIFASLFLAAVPLPVQGGGLKGKPAPSFTVTSLDGKAVSLDSLKGNVVVLNFWATSCPPCRAEIPEFVQFYRDFEKKGVRIIGLSIGIGDSDASLREFSKANYINYPLVNDRKNQISLLYGIRLIPTTFIIDRKGIISEIYIGGTDKEQLLKLVEPYLGP